MEFSIPRIIQKSIQIRIPNRSLNILSFWTLGGSRFENHREIDPKKHQEIVQNHSLIPLGLQVGPRPPQMLSHPRFGIPKRHLFTYFVDKKEWKSDGHVPPECLYRRCGGTSLCGNLMDSPSHSGSGHGGGYAAALDKKYRTNDICIITLTWKAQNQRVLFFLFCDYLFVLFIFIKNQKPLLSDT